MQAPLNRKEGEPGTQLSHVKYITIEWINVSVHGRRKPQTVKDRAKGLISIENGHGLTYFHRSLARLPSF